MGAKPSRRKSNGAEAPSEQKRDDLEAEFDILPTEEALQVDITRRNFTTHAAVKEVHEDVLNKSIKTMEAKMVSVSLEDATEVVAEGSKVKLDTLKCFSQEASSEIEFSISKSPADPAPIPAKPLTMEDQSIPEGPEHGAEAIIGAVEPLAMENDAVSGQEVSETNKQLVCETGDEA